MDVTNALLIADAVDAARVLAPAATTLLVALILANATLARTVAARRGSATEMDAMWATNVSTLRTRPNRSRRRAVDR